MANVYNFHAPGAVVNDIHDNHNCLIIPQTPTADKFAKDIDCEDVTWTRSHFPYISNSTLSEEKLSEIDDEIERTIPLSATKLLKLLRLLQSLKYIDIQHESTKDLYDTLNARYQLHYDYENFRRARVKLNM